MSSYSPVERLSSRTQSSQNGLLHSRTWANWTTYFTPEQRILYLRILVVVSLIIAAAICGTVNYLMQTQNEKEFASSQYDSISVQALDVMVGSFGRMNEGTLAMAKAYRYAFPNETSWPNVAFEGFYDMGEDITSVSSLDNVVFLPLFTADKRNSFSDFMFEYWATEPNVPDLSNTPVGIFHGVWANDPTSQTILYPDFDGHVTQYPTTNDGLFAVSLQCTFSSDITPANLGYNAHSSPTFGYGIDFVHDCVVSSANYSDARTKCGGLSDIIPLPPPTLADPVPIVTNLQAFITQPIVLQSGPDGNDGQIVGILTGAFNWKTLLSRAVPNFVSGMDCVVTTSTTSFTYTMINGVPSFKGFGDHHDPDFTRYAQTTDLMQDSPVTWSATSYQLTFYPRRSFFDAYKSDAPLNTTFGAIGIILFCFVVFVIYDVSMNRESTRKQLVLDTKRRFVRFISHEIRTPMNTVRLGLKLLEMEMIELSEGVDTTPPDQLPTVLRGFLENWMQLTDDILGNSDSAVDVLNDLLNYDKIEMGTLRLEFSSVDVWTLVKKTIAAFVMQAKQKSIDLEPVGDCWLPNISPENVRMFANLRCIGDRTRIAQVLRNLISNALKFTPIDGKVVVSVEWIPMGLPEANVAVPEDQASLLEHPRAGAIRISVTDSGAGLSEEQLDQICIEGMQFNANHLQAGQGSGLGLYISKGLAEQHGGGLTVTSEGLGKGATFIFDLPLFLYDQELDTFGSSRSELNTPAVLFSTGHSTAENSQETAPFSDVGDSTMQTTDTPLVPPRPKHVMVVDDAVSNRKLLMRILKAKGYECDGAEDGQQAVDLYISLRQKGQPVDAILMDFEMPIMDGPTATKRIRDLGCNCFIVGVTGNVLPADIDHFKAQGANKVFAKPLNIESFESSFTSFRASPDTENAITRPSELTGSVENV